jgi:hypothetical protein
MHDGGEEKEDENCKRQLTNGKVQEREREREKTERIQTENK